MHFPDISAQHENHNTRIFCSLAKLSIEWGGGEVLEMGRSGEWGGKGRENVGGGDGRGRESGDGNGKWGGKGREIVGGGDGRGRECGDGGEWGGKGRENVGVGDGRGRESEDREEWRIGGEGRMKEEVVRERKGEGYRI
ncbi:hypothetical protein Pcinc_025618 [Petrolisthes cinctipes]|uniref:Uncharacterized protein n=1 Tax=Petrolisthes cinctipes TaxID=88211 RepID=A0AAE1FA57_PETCI|nr:hypothetical protein Pcinc_025618 [Petrolisthes cinctipes]